MAIKEREISLQLILSPKCAGCNDGLAEGLKGQAQEGDTEGLNRAAAGDFCAGALGPTLWNAMCSVRFCVLRSTTELTEGVGVCGFQMRFSFCSLLW